MSAVTEQRAGIDPLDRGRMLPYLVLRDFLDEATIAGLLDHAISRQSDFKPTTLNSRGIDLSFRVSMGLRELGVYGKIFETRILKLVPTLTSQLPVGPIEASKLETELVAHGDGAFFKPHIDTLRDGDGALEEFRVLSGVYYFNSEPKAFTGGALRLYALGGKMDHNFIDIEPVRNTLLVFLAWAPHEVMPVSCPSKRFADSRFAINCWVHRKKTGAMNGQ